MYFVSLLMLLVTHGINTQEYQRPFFLSPPRGPTIPPGRPWPASAAGYGNFSQTTRPPQNNQPNVVNRVEVVPPTGSNNHRPSFHPNPGNTIGLIIPTGTPWPANSEGYSNFSQTTIRPQINQPSVVNRIEEVAQTRPNTNLPSFHPNPGSSLGPIIPPGTPWPANSEGYSNFSQTTIRPQVNQPNVVNRIEEVAQTRPNTNLPSFHPNPGSSLGPIIPPGTPWPANSEGYSNFSQTTIRPQVNQPSVVNRIEEVAQFDPNLVPSKQPWPFNPYGYNRLYRLISAEEPPADSTIMSTTAYDEDDDEDYESDIEETEEKITTKTTTATKPTHNIQKIKFKTKPIPKSREVPVFQGRVVLAPPPSSLAFFENLFDNSYPEFAQSPLVLAPSEPLFLPILG